jgi:hypothetical protein
MTSTTNEVNASSSSLASGDDVEAVCYLCLGGGVDENDSSPLRRDCACRGTDAGFVHLSCLTDYAETKSKQWDGQDMNDFINLWEKCPSCHQYYQNELAIDLATEFVLFVRRQYPDDTQMQVEALDVKLVALNSMLEILQPVQKREAGVTANVLLSLIDRMKNESPPLHMRYSQFQARAYGVHGRIALDEGTEESARRAVIHFENQLEVYKAFHDVEGVACAKGIIAIAKSKYEGGNNNEEMLRSFQEFYELRVAEYGEEDEYTIRAGIAYATDLHDANRGEEGRELLTKLLATSKQVLGPYHSTTKEVEFTHECFNTKINSANKL